MKAVIVGNGTVVDYDMLIKYVNESDLFVCCDGGINHAYKCGLVPEFILGDLDSADKKCISYFENKNVIFKKFPTKKDKTDMEIGLDFVLEKNADEIFIFGGMGSRFDHTLANAHILKTALDNGKQAWLVNENNKVTLVEDRIIIDGDKGNIVSLIPLTTKVYGVNTTGLEYELKNSEMVIGVSIGVSNVMTGEKAEISVQDGLLFVILSKD